MKKSRKSKSLPDKQSNFLLYTGNDGKVNVEVFLKDETVWLTQKAMAELFGVKTPAISKHVSNIFESGELQKKQLFPFWKQFKKKETGRSSEKWSFTISTLSYPWATASIPIRPPNFASGPPKR